MRRVPSRPCVLRRASRVLAAGIAVIALVHAGCGEKPQQQVWFAPNLASPDMLALFTQPPEWRSARASVDTFKFYEQALIYERPDQCPTCGANLLPAFEAAQAFARLAEWKIAIAIEVGVIKGHTCSPETNADLALRAMRAVELRGGSVRYLAMDEPLVGADECGIGLEQAARNVAAFAQRVHLSRPDVGIGDVEPYPGFGLVKLTAWLAALRNEGVAPAFFHLDVDRVHVADDAADVTSDLQSLQKLVEVQNLPFGVIFWGADRTDEAAYAADVLAWIETVRGAIGVPKHAVFQSWSRTADGRFVVPRNLPENDTSTMTHTRLINDGLRALRASSP